MTLIDLSGRPLVAKAVTVPEPSLPEPIQAKAATGWEQFAYSGAVPVSTRSRSPLKRMAEEQALYWSHPWIRVAERAVTRRVAGLPWHLEDADEDEVEDETADPRLRAVRELLEKPQAALPASERQPGIDSWTNLEAITSRHMGLCGLTHWYFDQIDPNGLPLAILYLNPARMLPKVTPKGQLLGWTLDAEDDFGNGGTYLEREEVLTFYLEPPDWGGLSSGLVQAAWLKAQITQHGDSHFLETLNSGGRLAGIVTPKDGIMSPEQYKTAANELRGAQESPDSAKRLTILSGPVDYHRTMGTSTELDLSAYSEMTRSDILTVWGVPDTQEGIPGAGGMNSGETRKYDEAVLYQGAVHDRVRVIRDTVQFGFLDRYEATGISPQLVIVEPTFDDRTPSFELAEKAKDQPLTRNERRELLGLDPLPEYGPDNEPLGLAIDLSSMITVIGQGEEAERRQPAGRFSQVPKPEPVVTVREVPQIPASFDIPAKASLGNRAKVVARFEPIIQKAVAKVLSEQAADVASKIRDKGTHIARKPSDSTVWWDADRWDKALLDAVQRGVMGLGGTVTRTVSASMGKASFADSVMTSLLSSVATRIAGINRTTRDKIAAIIADAFGRGLAPLEVAGLITDATAFDAARAELIARTETALVYNEAALRSYEEFGVSEVEAIDGDQDEECAARDGQVYSLDEAMTIEDHPNGTLDWVPVIPAKAEQPAFDLPAIVAALKAEPIRVTAEPNGLRTIIDYDAAGDFAGYHEESVAVIRDAYGDLILEETHA